MTLNHSNLSYSNSGCVPCVLVHFFTNLSQDVSNKLVEPLAWAFDISWSLFTCLHVRRFFYCVRTSNKCAINSLYSDAINKSTSESKKENKPCFKFKVHARSVTSEIESGVILKCVHKKQSLPWWDFFEIQAGLYSKFLYFIRNINFTGDRSSPSTHRQTVLQA